MNRLQLVVIPLLLVYTASFSQQLPLFTQYRDNQSVINPAAIHSDYLVFERNMTVGASYRSQWTQLPGHPMTQTLRFDYLNDQTGGIGLLMGGFAMNDQTGPTGFTGAYARFAGIISDDPAFGGISLGLHAGLVQYRVNAAKLRFRDENDIITTENQMKLFPDVGLGVYAYKMLDGNFLNGDYVYAGLSIPQVLGLDVSFPDENGAFFTKRVQHFYGMVGLIKLFDNDSYLEPTAWVKYTPNAKVNADFNLRYQLPTSFWIGAGLSTAKISHVEAGFLLGDNVGWDNMVRIGYSFDYAFASFGPLSGTSHEINVALSLER